MKLSTFGLFLAFLGGSFFPSCFFPLASFHFEMKMKMELAHFIVAVVPTLSKFSYIAPSPKAFF